MSNYPETVIRHLSERLRIDSVFLVECIEESVIEIHEVDGRWELGNATALRLRRLERICQLLDVDVPVAVQVLRLTQRVAELENEIRLLRG